jgi:hypothetical protein
MLWNLLVTIDKRGPWNEGALGLHAIRAGHRAVELPILGRECRLRRDQYKLVHATWNIGPALSGATETR